MAVLLDSSLFSQKVMLKHNLLMVFVGAAVVLGCDSGVQRVAPVSGTVTYNGQPVPGAHVSFVPGDGSSRAAAGLTDANGKFTLGTFSTSDGAIVGQHKVGVIANGPSRPARPGEGSGMPGETVPGPPLIPAKYFSPETSGLTQEVKPGNNSVELILKD
jgi:hypothetical protein